MLGSISRLIACDQNNLQDWELGQEGILGKVSTLMRVPGRANLTEDYPQMVMPAGIATVSQPNALSKWV